MNKQNKMSIVAVMAMLSGCGGGGGGTNGICQAIGTDGQLLSSSASIQIDGQNSAFDGDLSTFAEMYSLTGSGTAELAVKGSVSSAQYAGVLLGLPSAQVTQVNISVLLDGEVVRSGSAGTQSDTSQVCPGICQNADGQTYFGIGVGESFDEIRATLQISGTTEDTLVYELCVKN